MNWKHNIHRAPLGSGGSYFDYSPRKKEWIGLALAGASLASSIWGGAQSRKAQKKAEDRLAAENAANEAWYKRRYNEHTIDTAGGQNMIRMAKDYARENWKRAAGAAAVGGGTDAEVAEAKAAGNKMVGDTIANIEAQDVVRKDGVDAAYRPRRAQFSQQQMGLDQQKAENITQAAAGVSNVLASAASYFDGSPGGGGVNAPKKNQLQKMGVPSNEKYIEKMKDNLYDSNAEYIG